MSLLCQATAIRAPVTLCQATAVRAPVTLSQTTAIGSRDEGQLFSGEMGTAASGVSTRKLKDSSR